MKRMGLGVLVSFCFVGQLMAASPQPSKEWSILWVIDNSSSFLAQREIIKNYFPTFSEKLKAHGVSSFKMAVTHTDLFSQKGELISIGGSKVISGETPEGVDQFKNMIDLVKDTSTSFWEQGLESAYQAIEKEGKEFLSQDVPLAIIYVTDENDYSCETNCFGQEPENNPGWTAFALERYVAQFKSLHNTHHIKVSLFPVVGLPVGSCKVASYGERYLGVMNMMGSGHAFSVCPKDLVMSLDLVAAQLSQGAAPVSAPKWIANPIEISIPVAKPLRHSLAPYVINGAKLAGYSILSGPSWVKITADGVLVGVPGPTNVGDNVIQVRVCNQINECADTQVRVVVQHVNQPPVWTSFNIQLPEAKENTAYNVDLSSYVKDADGDALTFKALRIPPWLSISGQGVLSGTPSRGDVGSFQVDALVSDGNASAPAVLTGRVTRK